MEPSVFIVKIFLTRFLKIYLLEFFSDLYFRCASLTEAFSEIDRLTIDCGRRDCELANEISRGASLDERLQQAENNTLMLQHEKAVLDKRIAILTTEAHK